MLKSSVPVWLAVFFLSHAMALSAWGADPDGLAVAVSLKTAPRSGPQPFIIATLPPDGSTTVSATPVLQVVFSVDMDTARTDPTMVILPDAMVPVQLIWADARTLNIIYVGTLTSFGAKKVSLADRYFVTPGNMFVPIGSGYAFNYDFTIGPGGTDLLIVPQVKVKLALNGKTGKDSIKFTAILELPKDFDVGGKDLDVDFGGALQSFTLDPKGKGKAGKDKVSVKRKLDKGQFLGGAVRILVSMRGTFGPDLVDEGLDNATYPKPGEERFINVALVLDGDGYISQAEVLYKAKQDKVGLAIQKTVVR